MQLLKMDLGTAFTPQKSPQDHGANSNDKMFAPFRRERDSMNRLLVSTPPPSNYHHPYHSTKTHNKAQTITKEHSIHKKFNEFFKQQNVFTEHEPKKHKINKKTIVNVLAEQQQRRKSVHQTRNRQIPNDQRPSTQGTNYNRFSKTQSAQFTRTVSVVQPVTRVSSTAQGRRRNSDLSPKRQVSTSQSPKKVSHYEPKINIEQNLNKYPELNRYRRMQQLDFKLRPDFQKNHGLFLNKMIKSKQLAFKVRNDLNDIDSMCY